MEFAAPDPINHYIYIFPVAVGAIVIIGAILVFVVNRPRKATNEYGSTTIYTLNDAIFEVGKVLAIGALFTGLAVTIGSMCDRNNDYEAARKALHQADARVSVASNSYLSLKENAVEKVDLVTETGGFLNCQYVRTNDIYKVTCLDPASNGKMVSVDEALQASTK